MYKVYWDVRKGLIPLVGSSRQAGTSVLIEDVACEVDKLGDMTQDLIDMFVRFGYDDASVHGSRARGEPALGVSRRVSGTDEEVKKYAAMMQELCEIVAEKYQGSASRLSTAPGATSRRSWRWSGVPRRTTSCGS